MKFFVYIIAFLSGIVMAYFLGWQAGFLVILCLVFAYFKGQRVWLIMTIFFLFGLIRWHVEVAFFSVDNLALVRDQPDKITFFANVVSDPDKHRTYRSFIAEGCVNIISCGRIMVLSQRFPEFGYGDVLKLTGQLKSPRSIDGQNDLSYAYYLSVQKIYTVINFPDVERIIPAQPSFWGNLLSVKHYFLRQVDRLFLEPEGSLLAGLLLGVDSNLSKSVIINFRRAGLSHITAVSGYNINVVLIIILQFFYFVHRKYRLVLAWLFLLIYCGLVGLQPAVIRAFFMGSLGLMAGFFGRPKQAGRLLFMTAFLMVFYNPAYLLFDIGWQLSFAATAGLIWFSPRLEKFLIKIPNCLGLRSSLALTMAAQVATMPIVLFYFKQISWLSPLANLLVGPLIPWAMLFGFMAIMMSLIWFKAGMVLAYMGSFCLTIILKIAEIISII